MEILSSYDLLKKGKTTDKNKYSSGRIWQTYQMVTLDQKDDDWKKSNVDWFEEIGIRQLQFNYKRLIKNYQLANGVIDKSDYIEEQANDYRNILAPLTKDQKSPPSVMDITFFSYLMLSKYLQENFPKDIRK